MTLPRGCWSLLHVCRQFREEVKHHPALSFHYAEDRDCYEVWVPRRKVRPELDTVFLPGPTVLGYFFLEVAKPHFRKLLADRMPGGQLPRELGARPTDRANLDFFNSIAHLAFPYDSRDGASGSLLYAALPSLKTVSVVFGPAWMPPAKPSETQAPTPGREGEDHKARRDDEWALWEAKNVEPPLGLEWFRLRGKTAREEVTVVGGLANARPPSGPEDTAGPSRARRRVYVGHVKLVPEVEKGHDPDRLGFCKQ